MGKYSNCATLLQELVTAQKGRTNAQEGLYLLGMAEYGNRDYESASATFRKYCSSYPKGDFAEQASFYIGKSLYESTPEHAPVRRSIVGAVLPDKLISL